MVRGLVSHDSPTPRPDLEQELKDLRTEFADARRIGEGTNLSTPLKITQKLLVIPEIENALPDVPPPLPVDTGSLAKRGTDDYSADFDFFDEPSLTSKSATAADIEAAKLAEKAAETARLEAAEIEIAKVEAAKVDAARVEAERVEAEKIEAARIDAERI
jgi:hypothetical protein